MSIVETLKQMFKPTLEEIGMVERYQAELDRLDLIIENQKRDLLIAREAQDRALSVEQQLVHAEASLEEQRKISEDLTEVVDELRGSVRNSNRAIAAIETAARGKVLSVHPSWSVLADFGPMTVSELKESGIESAGLQAFLSRGVEIGLLEVVEQKPKKYAVIESLLAPTKEETEW